MTSASSNEAFGLELINLNSAQIYVIFFELTNMSCMLLADGYEKANSIVVHRKQIQVKTTETEAITHFCNSYSDLFMVEQHDIFCRLFIKIKYVKF